MRCTECGNRSCRKTEACGAESFVPAELAEEYGGESVQPILKAAAELVDDGLAGTLSRFQEVLLFIEKMGYKKVGIAYCYALEDLAGRIRKRIGSSKVSAVSCTVGGLSQNEINKRSTLKGVSCNPLGQARQLNNEGVDFVIVLGLCMGHDILFQREIKADCTTLLVKDRVYNHAPLNGILAELETK
jgi:uncharacterized metal-binding protein